MKVRQEEHFNPKVLRKLTFKHHWQSKFCDMPMLSLSQAILLRRMWTRDMLCNAMLLEMFEKFGAHELSTTVTLEGTYLATQLIHDKTLKFAEDRVEIWFILEWVKPTEARPMVDENYIVFKPLTRHYWCKTPEITVNTL